MISNDKLGTVDYRKVTTNYKQVHKNVHRISMLDSIGRLINPNIKYKKVSKKNFNKEWPFISDEVIVECRRNYFCLVEIGKYYYGLNGAAISRYNLMGAHDAGMAILGKSISPFIDIALGLSKKNK